MPTMTHTRLVLQQIHNNTPNIDDKHVFWISTPPRRQKFIKTAFIHVAKSNNTEPNLCATACIMLYNTQNATFMWFIHSGGSRVKKTYSVHVCKTANDLVAMELMMSTATATNPAAMKSKKQWTHRCHWNKSSMQVQWKGVENAVPKLREINMARLNSEINKTEKISKRKVLFVFLWHSLHNTSSFLTTTKAEYMIKGQPVARYVWN